MSKGKPSQSVMSLREKQHMNLDTESATHTGMEGQSRCSHKYLVLQVWCGLLTVAMVVMAAFLTSIKPKSPQHEVPTMKPDPVSPPADTGLSPLKSTGSTFSYVQLSWSPENLSWQDFERCHSCSLSLQNDSILCTEDSLYFFYAQVDFSNNLKKNQTKSVLLIRNPSYGLSTKKLIDATFPNTTVGPVWVAKVVSLSEGESVSIHIKGDFQTEGTFWGVYKLH